MLRRSRLLLALAMVGCRSTQASSPASEPPEPTVAVDSTLEPTEAKHQPEPELPPEPEPFTEGGAFDPTSDFDVWGNVEGTPLSESYGAGGLGQVGTGRGCTDCPLPPGLGLGTLPPHEPQPPVASITIGKVAVTGSLDAEFCRRNIRAHASEVANCWGGAGSGSVDLELSIDVRGKVRDVEVRTNDEAIGSCIEKAAATWKFPARQGSITLSLDVEAPRAR